MRGRFIAALVFAGSLLTLAGNVQPEPMARPAQVSRASVDAGTPNRLVYNAASTGVLADLAAITPSRLVISDANGLPIASSALTASRVLFSDGSGFPVANANALTASRVCVVDSGGALASNASLTTNRVLYADGAGSIASNAALTQNRLVTADASGLPSSVAAITASRALASDSNGLPVAATTTTTELNHVSGVTSAIQTQFGSKLGAVSDTSTVDLTISGGVTLSADVLRAALFPKTYTTNAGTDQSISALTLTNITGLSALNLPVLTTVNTRKFRVTGRVTTANGAGSGQNQFVTVYSGANGTIADTEIYRAVQSVTALANGVMIIGPFEFTPANSGHTKIGLGVFMGGAGTVFATSTTPGIVAHLLVEEVP